MASGAKAIGLSVVLPVALQVGFVWILKSVENATGWSSDIAAVAAYGLILVTGFTFVARRFRRYAIGVAVVYFPLMFAVIMYVGVAIACGVFGDCL